MTEVTLRTFIAAPVEVVFELARDIGFHERSMTASSEEAIDGRRSGPIALAETVTWRARHFGTWWTLQSRITEMTPPTGFIDEQVHGPFAWFRHVHTLRAVPGGTVMVDDWEHAAPFGALGWIADRLVLERHMRRLLATRNTALKREAEAEATARRQVSGSGM